MTIFNVFSLLGGLAMFLFGMEVMGDALQKQAGGRLQVILEKLTNSRIKGLLLGLVVTAVIQSSSATTVMVVGFVNSGIMQLGQAIGVIMGANIGTTVTSWILSLADIQGSNVVVQLLKPANFAPLFAFVGIILYMTGSKKETRKNIGTILMGFAILMIGMTTMSSAVEPLGDIPQFQKLFVMFKNPILGLLVGAVLTAVIQSSSASVGILQALSSTGAVTFGSAIPIILGQNIGTCVTAMLSSIGANKNARRAALIHLYFNIIGAVGFMVIFYVLNAIFHFGFINMSINKAGIAVVHSCFNILATLCMLPFTKGLEKLAYITIPEDKAPEEVSLLDERLLNTPATALDRSITLTNDMALMAREDFVQSLSLMKHWDAAVADTVGKEEETIDLYEDQLGSYLVKLSSRDMTAQDSRTVTFLFHAISDWERIGDHAVNVKMAANAMRQNDIVFSAATVEDLDVLEQAVQDMLDQVIDAFSTMDYDKASEVPPMDLAVRNIVKDIKDNHVARLQAGDCTMQAGIRLSDYLTDLQRVAAHCSNIALDMTEIRQSSYDRHTYREMPENTQTPAFLTKYKKYRERYILPDKKAKN